MVLFEIIILILLGIVVVAIQQFIRVKMANFTSETFNKLVQPKHEKHEDIPLK